ncbi:MAG: cupin domain-containing protein [Alphaproteobacteria bacterium]|nr:cupin domain-containing protein [Alphaproteobacteria bacterium]
MPILSFPHDLTDLPVLPVIPASVIAKGKPVHRGVDLLEVPELGLTAGVWDCTAWTAEMGPYSVDEFMIVLEGAVTIRLKSGVEVTVSAGHDGAGLVINPAQSLAPCAGPGADILIGPAPEQTAAELYEDATGQFSVGLWQSTPYSRKPVRYERYELMHLLSGSVTLTETGQSPQTFTAGETFLVPMGAEVDWVSTEDVRKIYCSVTPTAA